jgi:hypothetical protein
LVLNGLKWGTTVDASLEEFTKERLEIPFVMIEVVLRTYQNR